jgi:L-lactate dehydrogenase complex protein LldE
MDMFTPSSAQSLMELLERLGDTVVYKEELTCCGFKFYNEGNADYATALASKFFKEIDCNLPVIIPTASCSGFIRRYYRILLENMYNPVELKNFTAQCYELCDYLVNVKQIKKLPNQFNYRVFYFKSCSARNLYNLGDEPEQLLRMVNGLSLLEDKDLSQLCCAANSRMPFTKPAVSDNLLSQIITRIYQEGAQYVTSTDIHCLQHIDAYLQAQEKIQGLQVIPIGDILNADWE